MNVQSIINYCTNLGYRDLENFAGENYLTVYNYMTRNYDGEKVNTLLIGSIFTCVAADGKFNDAEWQFISSFIGGYSYEEAFSVAGEFYNDEAQDIVRQLVDLFPSDISEAFVSLCLAVLCVDGRVADYERYFLNKIL
jgi:hypothetical protein